MLGDVYTKSSAFYSTVKEWPKSFKLGRESLNGEPHPSRPLEAVTSEIIQLVEAEVVSAQRLKTPSKKKQQWKNIFKLKSEARTFSYIGEHCNTVIFKARWHINEFYKRSFGILDIGHF